MRFFLLTVALWVSISNSSAQPANGQTPQVLQRTIRRELRVDYLLFLPSGYATNETQRWPLMLFLHGAGERGTNLSRVKVHGPPKLVEQRPDFPFVTVSPQCPGGERWSNEALISLLDDVMATHRIDTNRVYLTGLSMGGFGSWSLALAYPERFAAVAPICGGGNAIEILLSPKRKLVQALPIWAFHGAKDAVVNVEESERMVAAMRKIGAQDVQLTVYPEADHDSWTTTYNDPKLYEWFLQHSRPTTP